MLVSSRAELELFTQENFFKNILTYLLGEEILQLETINRRLGMEEHNFPFSLFIQLSK
jgi:hypothetical protein